MGKRSREKRERRERGQMAEEKERSERGVALFCLNIIRWGVYLALFTPLIISANFFFPFVGPKSLYFMALVQIIFFAWLILIIWTKKYLPQVNLLLLALVIFVAILILSSFLGTDFSRSFWSKYERMTGLLMWFHLLAFFLVISTVFRSFQDWSKIFSISIFVAVLVAIISLLAKVGVDVLGLREAARGGATIGNSSFMGTYLLFNIFLALFLILKLRGLLRIYLQSSLAIMLLALFLAEARAATLSVLIGVIFLILLYLSFVPQKRYLNILGRISLIGIFIIFSVSAFYLFQPDNILHNWFVKMASKARLVVWEGAWKGFLERPWLGWGPENFEFVFTKYFNPCFFLPECGGEIWFDRAHNIILDTLIAIGIIGFLAYLGIFAACFYILWRGYFQKNIEFWLAAIFSVILISYFIQNLTVFDMINSYLMFLLVLGFIGSIGFKEEWFQFLKNKLKRNEIKNALRIDGFSRQPILIIVILFLFLLSFSKFVINPLRTDYYVIEALRVKDNLERLSISKKALETSPLGKYQIRTFFAEQFQGFLQGEAFKKIPPEQILSEFIFLEEELQKSIKESPLDFRSYLRLGQLYNDWAKFDSSKLMLAQTILEKAIELSPTNQQGNWALAQTKIYQGDFDQAIFLAEKSIELEPRVFQSHLVAVQIAKFFGKPDLAQKKIEKALEIDPSWESELKKILK